ncbi:MAG: hypothetical protein GY744_14470, partial [Gammaproteobacteria bacterium]|nr:hypothetical protein [Gammaproteobacteria bacterium]
SPSGSDDDDDDSLYADAAKQERAILYDYQYNRLTKVRYPDFPKNNVSYTYGSMGAPNNRAGRIITINHQSGQDEYFYGKLGEVLKETKRINTNIGKPEDNFNEMAWQLLQPYKVEADPSIVVETYTTQYEFDSWGRMQKMIYPDNEVLTYQYDSGGLLKSASGSKNGVTNNYLQRIDYDKFGQRVYMKLGNGTDSHYTYNENTRRLENLKTAKGSKIFQNLNYTFDEVGNILKKENIVLVPNSQEFNGPVTQTYTYDNLYRLTSSTGTYEFFDKNHTWRSEYSLSMRYDNIHNILNKDQKHDLIDLGQVTGSTGGGTGDDDDDDDDKPAGYDDPPATGGDSGTGSDPDKPAGYDDDDDDSGSSGSGSGSGTGGSDDTGSGSGSGDPDKPAGYTSVSPDKKANKNAINEDKKKAAVKTSSDKNAKFTDSKTDGPISANQFTKPKKAKSSTPVRATPRVRPDTTQRVRPHTDSRSQRVRPHTDSKPVGAATPRVRPHTDSKPVGANPRVRPHTDSRSQRVRPHTDSKPVGANPRVRPHTAAKTPRPNKKEKPSSTSSSQIPVSKGSSSSKESGGDKDKSDDDEDDVRANPRVRPSLKSDGQKTDNKDSEADYIKKYLPNQGKINRKRPGQEDSVREQLAIGSQQLARKKRPEQAVAVGAASSRKNKVGDAVSSSALKKNRIVQSNLKTLKPGQSTTTKKSKKKNLPLDHDSGGTGSEADPANDGGGTGGSTVSGTGSDSDPDKPAGYDDDDTGGGGTG